MRSVPLLCVLAFLFTASTATAQTGKISGVVTDAAGESLPGVNVTIDGTLQGSISDVDGYYVILNVRPGTYTIVASYVGFRTERREEVRVNIDLTTEIDFAMTEQTVGLDELVVVAERPVVQRDVSASVANITAEEIENIPITDIEKVVGLQAGFESGLTIRGFGGDQVQFMVDGQSMNSGRNNTPFTGVSYTSVQEFQVQTGGFNAEYGNVRSGLVNVITKDPSRDRYSFDAIVRYSSASSPAFAGTDVDGNEVDGVFSDRGFFLRPLTDPDVAMTGTTNWPEWMQREYFAFQGWNSIADSYNGLNGTSFTGAQLQEVFLEHYLRKPVDVDLGQYEIDATLGGPVPGLHQLIGDLRFQASYRQTQQPYEFGGNAREAFAENVAQAKLISNFAPGMELSFQGMYSMQDGLNRNEAGWPDLTTGEQLSSPWSGGISSMYPHLGGDLGEYASDLPFQLMDVDRLMLGAQFTHTLNSKTFYEVQLQSMTTDYFTRAISDRSEALTFSYLGGQLMLDEAPFGYTQKDRVDEIGVGIRTGGHWGSGYDNSQTQRTSGRFDLTSQLNRYMLGKVGVEYIYADYDVDYGEDDPEHPHNGDPKWNFHRKPQQAAAYGQTKLEFQGMVANIGLRLDYFHAGGDWYVFDEFDRAFTAQFGVALIDETLEQEPTDRQVVLSPRVGISFPVTENSKLYFNYGHFRNQLQPLNLFNIQQNFTGAVVGIGNPNHPMPKTVMYELGFEQNLFDQYLFRVAGYYRDLSQQPRGVNYISVDDLVNYSISLPWNYGDVRGLEFTVTRNRGRWLRGFVNYTYMVRKTGNFGFSRFDENLTAMNNFVVSTTEHYASKPIPEPFARVNLEILIPDDVGPEVGGRSLLGDWRINLLGEWRRGQSMTWDGQSLGATSGSGPREFQGNVRYRDHRSLDLRFSKNFATSVGNAQFFIDITNVLNIRQMYLAGNAVFANGDQDLQAYMQSLHLPQETIPNSPDAGLYGDDKPGDFRKPGVEFVPIIQGALPETGGEERPLYYVPGEDAYYQWNGSSFAAADESQVNQVLDDKAYINMPNATSSTWLYPRNVYFGLRLSF